VYSIRRRLLLVLVAGFSVLIAGAALFMEGSLREQATAEFDAALVTEARALVSLTEQELVVDPATGRPAWRVEFDYDAAHMTQFERAEDPDLYFFRLDDGSPLLRSRRLAGDLPARTTPPGEPKVFDGRFPDGRAGRIANLTFTPKVTEEEDDDEAVAGAAPPRRTLHLAVGRARGPLDRVLATMRWTIFGAGGIAVALAGLLAWWAVRAGFRPIRSIAGQVARLDADRLGSAVALPRTPEELAPIQDQLNALLRRLHASFERERRFTGNVAHELKTPLAELRSLADVGAKWPEDRDAIVGFFHDVRDVADRMDGVIADLLLLARCQAGAERVRESRVDLQQAIRAAWARVAAGAKGHDLRFSVDLPGDFVVESDPGKLDIILGNVLGNAVSYSRPGTEIRCSGSRNGRSLQIEIANEAEPMEPAELERLAEPFWRRDEARASSRHAGLGLSVVEAVAALLRMRVGFAQDRDGTFRVRLVSET